MHGGVLVQQRYVRVGRDRQELSDLLDARRVPVVKRVGRHEAGHAVVDTVDAHVARNGHRDLLGKLVGHGVRRPGLLLGRLHALAYGLHRADSEPVLGLLGERGVSHDELCHLYLWDDVVNLGLLVAAVIVLIVLRGLLGGRGGGEPAVHRLLVGERARAGPVGGRLVVADDAGGVERLDEAIRLVLVEPRLVRGLDDRRVRVARVLEIGHGARKRVLQLCLE